MRPRGSCVLTSTLPCALEVRTVPIADGRGSRASSLPTTPAPLRLVRLDKRGRVEESVFESERFFPFVGWQEPKGQIDEFFTARFSRSVSGKGSVAPRPDVPLPEGWRWDGAWNRGSCPADGASVDGSGWAARSTGRGSGRRRGGFETRGLCATRRRRWRRTRVPVGSSSEVGSSSSSSAADFFFASSSSRVARFDRPRGGGRLGGGRLESLDASAGGLRRTPMRRGDDTWASTCASSVTGADGRFVVVVVVVLVVVDVGHAMRARAVKPVAHPRGFPGSKEQGVRLQLAGDRGSLPSAADPSDPFGGDEGRGPERTRFVVVVPEPDAGVTAGDALGGGKDERAWRLVAHPPLSIQTALPCDCEYEVIDASTGARAVSWESSGPE